MMLVKLPIKGSNLAWGRAQKLIKGAKEVIEEKKTQRRYVIQSCIEYLLHNRWHFFSFVFSSLLLFFLSFVLAPLYMSRTTTTLAQIHTHHQLSSLFLTHACSRFYIHISTPLFRKGYISLILSQKKKKSLVPIEWWLTKKKFLETLESLMGIW